jgi:hypothetical protein
MLKEYRSVSWRLALPAYSEEPDRLNVQIKAIPVVARAAGYTLHANRVEGKTQQFLAAGHGVWVTMHVVPTGDRMQRSAAVEWFRRFVMSAKARPAPEGRVPSSG